MFFLHLLPYHKKLSQKTPPKAQTLKGRGGANRSLGKYNVLLLFSVIKPGLYHLAKVYAVEKDEDDMLFLTCPHPVV